MDFSRAEWVANLPAGEDTVRSELERLRGQVEDVSVGSPALSWDRHRSCWQEQRLALAES